MFCFIIIFQCFLFKIVFFCMFMLIEYFTPVLFNTL